MCLPREGFLAEVHIPLGLPFANRASELVSQRSCSTGRHARRPNTLLHLLIDESLHVRSTGEHLHAGGGRVDFLGAPRPSNEKQDLENFATAGHGEDVRHPCSDPFKVLRRLDDPDQGKPAGGGGAVGVSGNELSHVRDLVRDTNTRSPEHDSAIRAQIFATCNMTLAWCSLLGVIVLINRYIESLGKLASALTIRPLHKCRGRKFTSRRKVSLLVKLLGETCSSSNDEGHARLAVFENVLAVHRKALLLSDYGLDVEVFFLFTPGKRERMIGPQSDGRHVEICMLPGPERPRAGHTKRDAKRITWENLNIGLRTTVAHIS